MARYLTADCGNTSIKVTLWTDTTPVEEKRLTCLGPEELAELPTVDAAIVGSVRTGAVDLEALSRKAARVYVLDSSLPLPIAVDYATPATLGADRVAGACGVAALYPGEDVLVVDAGTAVTYDYVDAAGRFCGGNIAPGLRMRLEALHRFTSRLPLVEPLGDVALMGTDTASALQAGALHGIVGEIEYYRQRLGRDTLTVVTGGDARTIAPLLASPRPVVVPELVSIGLNRILIYNENK